MYPLIEIKTVPIEIEMKTKNARLEYTRGTAEMEISRDDGGMKIKSRPIKLRLDSFEARNSITPTTMRSWPSGSLLCDSAVYPERKAAAECKSRAGTDYAICRRRYDEEHQDQRRFGVSSKNRCGNQLGRRRNADPL